MQNYSYQLAVLKIIHKISRSIVNSHKHFPNGHGPIV